MRFKGNLSTFYVLIFQFIGLLFLYSLLRVGFYLFNKDLFGEIGLLSFLRMMAGGIRFDIVALLYINILYILILSIPIPYKHHIVVQHVSRYIFVVTNAIGILANLADYAYYPFTLKRTTGTVFDQFKNEDNLGRLIGDFLLDYWYLLVVFILFIYLLYRLSMLLKTEAPSVYHWKFYLTNLIGLLVVAFLFVGGVRGDWAHSTRPITLSNAGDYVNKPEEMSIVLNTPFSIMKTLEAVNLQEKHFFSDDELEHLYPVIHQPKTDQPFKPLNVVFLILESFGKEHVGALNKDIDGGNYKGYTPFLDSLIEHAYTFSHTYANGRKSIDALPSVITGVPSISEPFVLSIYSANNTTSIAKLLGQKGYETAFFHGAPNGSMGFSAYIKMAGIKHYFGKDEYNNDKDFDGIWGIWDEPFMQFMANKLNTFKEPFFASLFSVSSHHPFKVPEQYKGVFPKGPLPVQEPVGYTDHALKEFFAKASAMPWYKNTLFVLCADHATVSYLPEYTNAVGAHSIPIIFYYPGGQLKGMADRNVQQIDILPTVLNYLHYDKPYLSFGFDAFDQVNKNNFVINYFNNSYMLYYKDYVLTSTLEHTQSLYNLKEDRLLQKDLSSQKLPVMDTMENKLRAFVQQYNYRMIHNKLTATP